MAHTKNVVVYARVQPVYRLPALCRNTGNRSMTTEVLAMSRTSFSFARVLVCGLFIFSAMITAQAQFRAGIQGTISDSSGALVPEAKVTLKDLETGKVQEVTSSDEGFYRILGLAPGRYELTVEKEIGRASCRERV